jgi:uracil-DNA glycosylase
LNRLAAPLGPLLQGDFGDWQPLIDRWRRSPEGQALVESIDRRVQDGALVYPATPLRALLLTPLSETKVLILGQDPYHGPAQAEGLAFSVPPGQRPPPSLRNIFKELQRDLGLPMPGSGSLLPWARQGVLLLNTSLTVEDGRPGCHARLGWQALTDAVCGALAHLEAPHVFMLWGAHAQQKAPLLAVDGIRPKLLLQCNHPSPLSATRPPAPFIGCSHFSQANAFLAASGRGPVDWRLP